MAETQTCRRCGRAEHPDDLLAAHVVERHVEHDSLPSRVTLTDLGRVYLHPSCYSIWHAREGERFELVAEWVERPEPATYAGAFFCTLCGLNWSLHHPLHCSRQPQVRPFDYKSGTILLTLAAWWERVDLCLRQLAVEAEPLPDFNERAREMWLSNYKPAKAAAWLLNMEVPRGL